MDKISELSNQPDKTGKTLQKRIITHKRIYFSMLSEIISHSGVLFPSVSMDPEKMETNSISHQVKQQ